MLIARYVCYLFAFVVFARGVKAQDVFAAQRKDWLQKAEQNKPVLNETVRKPTALVTLVRDSNAFQGWKTVPAKPLDSLYQQSFKKQSGVVLDFGDHLTGFYSFTLKARRGTPDGPLRFRFTFGEVPAEMATPFDPYPGSLSRAWLQDEVVTVMELPATVTIPRRLAFRYVKIDLLGSSPYFDFGFDGMEARATTAATKLPAALPANTDPIIREIDRVGQATLKECMQTVFEDGPKRDRRLWTGDLYLQSITNAYSFQNFALTRRCLYLLAGVSGENGYLNSNVFETPQPHAQVGAPFLFEYSLLYNAALKEYLAATGDRQTAMELWPVAKKQLENISRFLLPNGMFDYAAAAKAGWWLFVDWSNTLDKQASIQGLCIFALQETLALAALLGKQNDISAVPGLIGRMTAAARKTLYDKQRGVFVSGPEKQVSYASQAWMILSSVATNTEAQRAIKNLQALSSVVRPGGPYLYHYYIEAMLKCGMQQEARNELEKYWGGMVKKGADTFWEVYDPANDFLSPYNFYPVNSYCHAWSCTPVYFIRKYANVFQKD
ncbi:alpha-L-rhamnosidase-related protein [Flavisolibacter nicotianae]|uniref:alpha-L-rhamnosidase-related protein n=1 Tax=Flavisolibacter nicotianae TaxID=2364882 RepID=UPI000EAF81E8|nr:family 78 glycoside hydrolase catalytic domain [Flavisolibacter nicotianae]